MSVDIYYLHVLSVILVPLRVFIDVMPEFLCRLLPFSIDVKRPIRNSIGKMTVKLRDPQVEVGPSP